MREALSALIADLDNKYKRVKAENLVCLDSDFTGDFHHKITTILKKHPQGSYKVLCVHYPDQLINLDPSGVLSDAELDTKEGEMWALWDQLVGGYGGWVIPDGDKLYNTDDLCLVFNS